MADSLTTTILNNLVVTGSVNANGGFNDIDVVNTLITTVGNGVLTAVGINSGLITRSGPVAAFSDTTDTATAILAGITNPFVGQSFFISIKNSTAFIETLLAGAGVTLPTTVTIPPLSIGTYFVTVNSVTTPAVTFAHFQTVTINPRVTTLRCGTQLDAATNTTLADIPGLTGLALDIGTYTFAINLYGTAGGTGGWKVAFNYTTAVLSAINANALAYTASAVAASNTTTTTTQTSIIASNTAFTNAAITGTMVVSTAGTVALQFAENSSNGTSSIFVGSTMAFTRIA